MSNAILQNAKVDSFLGIGLSVRAVTSLRKTQFRNMGFAAKTFQPPKKESPGCFNNRGI